MTARRSNNDSKARKKTNKMNPSKNPKLQSQRNRRHRRRPTPLKQAPLMQSANTPIGPVKGVFNAPSNNKSKLTTPQVLKQAAVGKGIKHGFIVPCITLAGPISSSSSTTTATAMTTAAPQGSVGRFTNIKHRHLRPWRRWRRATQQHQQHYRHWWRHHQDEPQ